MYNQPQFPQPKKKISTGGWVAIIIGILIVIGSVSGTHHSSSGSSSGSDSGVSSGFGSQDATGDVSVGVPSVDSIGVGHVTVSVTNSSSKRSDYYVEFAVDSADQATQYATSNALVNSVEPGQSGSYEAMFQASGMPADAVIVLTKVERTASS